MSIICKTPCQDNQTGRSYYPEQVVTDPNEIDHIMEHPCLIRKHFTTDRGADILQDKDYKRLKAKLSAPVEEDEAPKRGRKKNVEDAPGEKDEEPKDETPEKQKDEE